MKVLFQMTIVDVRIIQEVLDGTSSWTTATQRHVMLRIQIDLDSVFVPAKVEFLGIGIDRHIHNSNFLTTKE